MKKQESFDDLVFKLFRGAKIVATCFSLAQTEMDLKNIKDKKQRKIIQDKIDEIKKVIEVNYERFYRQE